MGDSQASLILASWSFEPVPALGLLLAALVYWRVWGRVRRLAPERFPEWRLASFIAGLIVAHIALASPLDAFASWLLSVHMVQHLLLTMVVPPLILQGPLFLPMLSGLPRGCVRHGLGPFLSEPRLKKISLCFVHPLFAGPLFMLSNVLWHLPAFYELGLGSTTIHQIEHLCFLGTALLFW
jgi:putative membrane protein